MMSGKRFYSAKWRRARKLATHPGQCLEQYCRQQHEGRSKYCHEHRRLRTRIPKAETLLWYRHYCGLCWWTRDVQLPEKSYRLVLLSGNLSKQKCPNCCASGLQLDPADYGMINGSGAMIDYSKWQNHNRPISVRVA